MVPNNAMGMGQLGNKSPNVQPQSNLANSLGMNSLPMTITNNGTSMSTMQGILFFYYNFTCRIIDGNNNLTLFINIYIENLFS